MVHVVFVSGHSLSVFVLVFLLLMVGCSSQPTPVKPVERQPAAIFEPGMTEAEMAEVGRRYGPLAEARVRYWQQMIKTADNLTSDQAKLKQVNDFINGAQFVDDKVIWQQEDYWATPLEFLIMDAGDCEDFSLAKYFTLEKMGLSIDKMRLTYVKALSPSRAHMVLSYYPDPKAVPLVLDNLKPDISPATERLDLIPVYSFNGNDLWLAKTRTQHERVGPPTSLKPWMGVKQRINSGIPNIAVKP